MTLAPALPERPLFLFDSLPSEGLCHRGLLAAVPFCCCAQHGTKLPAHLTLTASQVIPLDVSVLSDQLKMHFCTDKVPLLAPGRNAQCEPAALPTQQPGGAGLGIVRDW